MIAIGTLHFERIINNRFHTRDCLLLRKNRPPLARTSNSHDNPNTASENLLYLDIVYIQTGYSTKYLHILYRYEDFQ